MQSLREIFYSHTGGLVHKWDHYFEIYERFFSRYRGKEVSLMEIGVSQGGSIQMWRKYFGKGLRIYCVDINEECRAFESETERMFIGSQEDPGFLRRIREELPPMDIVIDDGGHTMRQQILTFQHLFPLVKEGGIFLVEDTHTSYWRTFGGGLGRRSSFIEYCKSLVDSLHSDHMIKGKGPADDELTRSIGSISFFDSVVVFEKRMREPSFHLQKGTASIKGYVAESSWWENLRSMFVKGHESTFDRNFRR
jgi:hypothetical protein